MRAKTYTRERILKASYLLLEKEGFRNFTARNVAKQMGISTQPIYLEFKNMKDLKQTLIITIIKDLQKNIFSQVHTGDKLIDLSLNYIYFAKENPKLFTSLFIDDHGGGELIYQYSFDNFKKLVKEMDDYQGYSESALSELHNGLWIVITGIASLMSSGMMDYEKEKIILIVEQAITALVAIRKKGISLKTSCA